MKTDVRRSPTLNQLQKINKVSDMDNSSDYSMLSFDYVTALIVVEFDSFLERPLQPNDKFSRASPLLREL